MSVSVEQRKRVVRQILRVLNASSNEVEASAAISTDGLVIASVLDEGVDPDRFGAMCASLLALAERAAQEISRGALKQIHIAGENGTMLLIRAGADIVLAVSTKPTVNLGMIFIEARKTALNIEKTMSNSAQ